MNTNADQLDARWLEAKRRELGADPVLLEKAVRCLDLVATLRREGLDFLFKGGTSLLVILPDPGRLSIDVDIATDLESEALEEALEAVVTGPVTSAMLNPVEPLSTGLSLAEGTEFTGYYLIERETRAGKPIPKLHYELEYDPIIYQRRGYILLDVILEEPNYADTYRPIGASFYTPADPPEVRVPTLNSSLGDKLAALAPTTTGIPFGVAKELPRAKQLFDVGRLVEAADDPMEMAEAFARSVEQEGRFAGEVHSPAEVAQDLISFARLASMLDFRGAVEDERTREIRDGVRRLASYVLRSQSYTHARSAKEDAARAAFCAGLLQRGLTDQQLWNTVRRVAKTEVERLPELLNAVQPGGDFAFVHRLRRAAPVAAIYWCACLAPEVFQDL